MYPLGRICFSCEKQSYGFLGKLPLPVVGKVSKGCHLRSAFYVLLGFRKCIILSICLLSSVLKRRARRALTSSPALTGGERTRRQGSSKSRGADCGPNISKTELTLDNFVVCKAKEKGASGRRQWPPGTVLTIWPQSNICSVHLTFFLFLSGLHKPIPKED